MAYLSDQGETVSLGKQLAGGGAGGVFEVLGSRDRLAKIYARPLLEKHGKKLEEMVRLGTPELMKFSAWPLDVLRPSEGEPVRGLLMRRIDSAQPLSDLSSPAHRRFSFPTADWKTLIRAARGCALAAHQLHHAGVVLGSVSSDHFLVDQGAFVTIVGCDAFQFTVDSVIYFSRAGALEYLAPEVQTAPMESFPLTRNHDAFGLAIVIFRLLMMNRHPFAGYRGPNKVTIGEAIREFRFAFGPTAATLMMEPPPHSLLLSDLPDGVANLFQRAFMRGSEREGARPSEVEWMKALDDLERQTETCAADPGHVYFAGLSRCPWCRLERSGAPDYFSAVTGHTLENQPLANSAQQILDEFETILPPERHFAEVASAPLLPATPTPLPAGTRGFQQIVTGLGVLTIGAAVPMLLGFFSLNFVYIAAPFFVFLAMGWLAAFLASPLFRVRRARRRNLATKKAELAQLQQEMAAALTRLNADWNPRFKAAAEARDKLRALDVQETNELQLLRSTLKERQLDEYLSRYFLCDTKLEELTPSRLAILESFGAETARDVTERNLSAIPGLGKTLPATLLGWRRAAEAGFSFDPQRGPPPTEIAKIRNKFYQQRLPLQEQLEVDLEALGRISANARAQAGRFNVPYAARQSAVVQAMADWKASNDRSSK